MNLPKDQEKCAAGQHELGAINAKLKSMALGAVPTVWEMCWMGQRSMAPKGGGVIHTQIRMKQHFAVPTCVTGTTNLSACVTMAKLFFNIDPLLHLKDVLALNDERMIPHFLINV